MSARRKILMVAGARPNFMKVAPLAEVMAKSDTLEPLLIHTGQHYDPEMSQLFFDELGMPKPHRELGVGSDTHARQTARVMERLEDVMLQEQPDAVIVVGDVNSTMAGAIVAAKLTIPVGHVEAGLRSFDRTMPEEVNRVVTDQLSRWLFTPSRDGDENLRKEGIRPERIHFVGNVMIDTLLRFLPLADRSQILQNLGLKPGGYVLVTLHRPSNVDDPARLDGISRGLAEVAEGLPVVFPVHPRTKARMESAGLGERLHSSAGLHLLPPQSYLDFMALLRSARLTLTDSGGIQEEATVLRIPCLTFRPNTERPITVSMGTNKVLGEDPGVIVPAVMAALRQPYPPQSETPPLWDGQASSRILEILERDLGG
jgi:UDP-N-acetylglucosamine 2-epimerase (non-hydrolysing)